MQENHYLIPAQQQGFKKDIAYKIGLGTTEEAESRFVDAKDRLLDVNSWNTYENDINVYFRLTDTHGIGLSHTAYKGNLVRIGTSMPGLVKNKFAWMCVDAIEYDDYPDLGMEIFALRVIAATDPLYSGAADTHKDSSNATATFVIERRGVKLTVSYHSRNNMAIDTIITDKQWEGLMKAFTELGA